MQESRGSRLTNTRSVHLSLLPKEKKLLTLTLRMVKNLFSLPITVCQTNKQITSLRYVGNFLNLVGTAVSFSFGFDLL